MSQSASELFIVDNSDSDWKVRSYLSDWCDLSSAIDIATGYFEIGALLSLKDQWQKVDRIRILMGDEVSLKTKRAFSEGLRKVTNRLEGSLESEKVQNDFLEGVPAIVEAIRKHLTVAVRRCILASERGRYALCCRDIGDYNRDELIDALLGAIGRGWTEREDAIRAAARWLGFQRTGRAIQESFKSAINGAIRRGWLEKEGSQIRKLG
jgi:hypothetical protein